MENINLDAKREIPEIKKQEIPLMQIQKFIDRVQEVRLAGHKKPSQEREEEIRMSLNEVADIFQDANVHYIIDGAINIPLYKNKFFREHRDIDFGVFTSDIPKLASVLEKKGYALFRFPKDVDEIIEKRQVLPHELVRPDQIDISQISREHIFFLKVKNNFEIDVYNYEVFDIHALDQNENGDIIRLNGTVIPKEYYLNAPKYKTESNKELQLCHPIILAYNKLLVGRHHDIADLEYMIKEKMITSDSLAKVDNLLEQDEKNSWEEDKPKIAKARKWIKLRMQ